MLFSNVTALPTDVEATINEMFIGGDGNLYML